MRPLTSIPTAPASWSLSQDRILVFVKAPIEGLVKTRVARDTDPETALEVYSLLLERLREVLGPLDGVHVWFTPASGQHLVDRWRLPSWTLHAQPDGSLGDRLRHAVRHAFADGARRLILIGADCPALEARDFQRTWKALDQVDLVLGPSRDGGYWLLGLKHPHDPLFERIDWSTDLVLTQTCRQAEALGLSCHFLDERQDIDTWADWQQWTGSNPS